MAISLPELFRAEKRLTFVEPWQLNEEDGRLKLIVALDSGEVSKGLILRGITLRDGADENVLFQIEQLTLGRQTQLLGRIDWRPHHTHNNKGRGPIEWQHIEQIGTHHHSFDLNWLEQEGRMRAGNLPIAVPLDPDPVGFQALLAHMGECFRIVDTERIPPPGWERRLF